jgi:nitrate reductase gamma subunit
MGLGIPESWTSAVGISEELYHFFAVTIGVVAGFCTLVGLTLLIYRRRTVGPVFSATTRMDKVMYLFLALVIVLGVWNTVAGSILNLNGEYNYRTGVSEWFRGIFLFQPQPELMVDAPFGFQAHAMVAMLLFALWPFTRLVHVLSVPVFYLWRPYVVYRSRSDRTGSRATRPGWSPSDDRVRRESAARRVQAVRRLGQQRLEHRVPVQGPQERVVVVPATGVVDGVVRLAGRRSEAEPGGTGDLPADLRLDLRCDAVVLIDDGHVLDLLRPCSTPCCPHAARPHPHGCGDTRWRYSQRARRRRPRTFPVRPGLLSSSAFPRPLMSLSDDSVVARPRRSQTALSHGSVPRKRIGTVVGEPLTSPCDGC